MRRLVTWTAAMAIGFATLQARSTLQAATDPAEYVFSVLAGADLLRTMPVDGSATAARFATAQDIARGPDGHFYVVDRTAHVIRRVTAAGDVTTIAGVVGRAGAVDGPARLARFNDPQGITVDSDGVVYVADTGNHTIRRISTSGQVTTLAGLAGVRGFANGAGRDARFERPIGIVAGAGVVYVSDELNHVIRRITPSGEVVTLAGRARDAGFDDGTGTAARFNFPNGLALDSAGRLFVADWHNSAVRRVLPDGTVTTVARSQPSLGFPRAVTVLTDGALMVGNQQGVELHHVTQDGVVTRVAGSIGDARAVDGVGLNARFALLGGLTTSPNGDVLVADASVIRRIAPGAIVSTVAGRARPVSGGFSGVGDGPGDVALFSSSSGIVADGAGGLYVADAAIHTLRRVSATGQVSTFAGLSGISGAADGNSSDARFNRPTALVRDNAGLLYVADQNAGTIRRVTPSGQVTTIAGTAGLVGTTDGVGVAARFRLPSGLAINSGGHLFVADTSNHTIRRIAPDGTVTTFAGTAGVSGSADGTGAAARFFLPTALAIGPDDTLYVSDFQNSTIRAISPDGRVTTLAGVVGVFGYRDGPAANALFGGVRGVAVDTAGRIVVTDNGNRALRRIASGVVSTVSGAEQIAGNGLVIMPDGSLFVSGDFAIRRGIPVSVAAPRFETQPTSQSINAGQTVTFTVAATGTPAYRWEVSADGTQWAPLSDMSPYTGAATSSLTVAGATRGQQGLWYRAVATNTHGTSTSEAARLTVAEVLASPQSIRLGAARNTATGALTAVSAPVEVTVSFAGLPPGTAWTAHASQSWIQISSTSGTGPGRFAVQASDPGPTGLLPSQAAATVIITAPGAVNSPLEIPVTLDISRFGATPRGHIDTPANGATSIRGAIGVTGWAIDDIGIARVDIYRNCVSGEPQINCESPYGPGGPAPLMVYIGQAARVPGARPDVAAQFPELAEGDRAGWGYLLLTSMLPRSTGTFAAYGGQGPVTLHVFLRDREGRRQPIGQATITLDNDNIAKPFGALDTPEQGQTVSGLLPIFGWALTPDGGTGIVIPPNGSTMTVFIDGAPHGQVLFNQCRGNVGNPPPAGVFCNDDVASIFGNTTEQPTFTPRTMNPSVFRNLDAGRGAIGSYVLDTTTLTNGFHSLAWSVTDSAGRVEGIGSRNFVVFNPDAPREADVFPSNTAAHRSTGVDVHARPPSAWIRTGFDLTQDWVDFAAGDDGVRRVTVPQLGRLELWISEPVTDAWLESDDARHALPVGSALNGRRFTWALPAGYFGDYRLAFQVGGNHVAVVVSVR